MAEEKQVKWTCVKCGAINKIGNPSCRRCAAKFNEQQA